MVITFKVGDSNVLHSMEKQEEGIWRIHMSFQGIKPYEISILSVTAKKYDDNGDFICGGVKKVLPVLPEPLQPFETQIRTALELAEELTTHPFGVLDTGKDLPY